MKTENQDTLVKTEEGVSTEEKVTTETEEVPTDTETIETEVETTSETQGDAPPETFKVKMTTILKFVGGKISKVIVDGIEAEFAEPAETAETETAETSEEELPIATTTDERFANADAFQGDTNITHTAGDAPSGRRWIPMRNESKDDFVTRAKRTDHSFDIGQWEAEHGTSVRRQFPDNFGGSGW
jgi:hypothetical protein